MLYQDRKIMIFILIHVESSWGYNVVLIMCNQIGDIFSGNGHNTEDLNDSKYLAIKDNFSDADIPGLIQKVFSSLRIMHLCNFDGLLYDMGTFRIWVIGCPASFEMWLIYRIWIPNLSCQKFLFS